MNAWTTDLIPRVLPSGYRIMDETEDGARLEYRGMRGYHTVILSAAVELDQRRWLHVSVATPTKLPSWELLKEIKQIFIGRNKQAVQVMPTEERYINLHPYCLHLFHCLEENDPVPDFTRGGPTL
jgi:hypothetical protein